MFICLYSSKDGTVIVGNQLLHAQSICWVQISPNSMADKRLKALFVSHHGISPPHISLVSMTDL